MQLFNPSYAGTADPRQIEVIDSWDMSTGLIADLKHWFDGLQPGLIVQSLTTGKQWNIQKRILFLHAIDRQKKFTNEELSFSHMLFTNIEASLISAERILNREEQNIFQYLLQSVGQHEKLVAGDILIPVIVGNINTLQ